MLPAGSEELGHGSRRAAVTKLCQAQWSPGNTVTQRHTSGVDGGQPQTMACPHGSPERGSHCCSSSVPRNPSLTASAHVWSCGGAGSWWDKGQLGAVLPYESAKIAMVAAPAKGSPQLKPDLGGARREQKLSVLAKRQIKGQTVVCA